MGSLDKILGSTVKVSTKDRRQSPSFFLRATGRSPEASLLVSELLSGQRLHGEMERNGLQLELCLSPPSSGDFRRSAGNMWLCGNTWRGTDLCVLS